MNGENDNIFLSRELSWLDFNARVLEEAEAAGNPLLERLKFIAIFSSNLDEFFMVRISGLRHMLAAGQDAPDPAGYRPSVLLPKLYQKVRQLQQRQYRQFAELRNELCASGIVITDMIGLSASRQLAMHKYFEEQILPVLTPIAIDPFHPFPILNSGAIEIAVSIIPAGRDQAVHALVEVPEMLPRFIPLSGDDGKVQSFLPLEELIMAHLGMLFADCKILELLPFRITRDMDLTVNEDGVEDLLLTLEKTLLERRTSEPVRLEMPRSGAPDLAEWLKGELKLEPQAFYAVDGPLHLKQLFELVSAVKRPDLLEPPWPPVGASAIGRTTSIFDDIAKRGPIMIVLPFQRFDPVLELLQTASRDPAVLAIKQTLYRVSGNSPVVKVLQQAAESGKQVTVIVELKARFDEGNNIVWAKRLEESGAHVVYGISGLKIHGKALLVVRREGTKIVRYVHLATGNYNDKTATLYTDIGYFSCDPKLTADIANWFNVMTGYSAPGKWNKIAVAPFDLRKKFLAMIDRERDHAAGGKDAFIIAKMNSLVDSEIIEHLYAAARAGVKVELIVRGICCLRPGVGTANIRVISIVDRYLEHMRIYCFANAGNPEFYLSSADWMLRNLDRRIELLFPIENPRDRELLWDILHIQMADREKARELKNDGTYTKANSGSYPETRSQQKTYDLIKQTAAAAPEEKTQKSSGSLLKIFKWHK
ncbi:MAG: polyphosphate kinase 1 [Victivallaceae bacterium]|nr:polyphosphate kinase 1 [Victivallaceae bacterium]